jgi:hypothetical protein
MRRLSATVERTRQFDSRVDQAEAICVTGRKAIGLPELRIIRVTDSLPFNITSTDL